VRTPDPLWMTGDGRPARTPEPAPVTHAELADHLDSLAQVVGRDDSDRQAAIAADTFTRLAAHLRLGRSAPVDLDALAEQIDRHARAGLTALQRAGRVSSRTGMALAARVVAAEEIQRYEGA
jgi:hypothetical protein